MMWLEIVRTMMIFRGLTASLSHEIVNYCTDNRITSAKRLTGHEIKHIQPLGMIMCAKECVMHTDCKSWNFEMSNLRCELNFETMLSMPADVKVQTGWYYGKQADWRNVKPIYKNL